MKIQRFDIYNIFNQASCLKRSARFFDEQKTFLFVIERNYLNN